MNNPTALETQLIHELNNQVIGLTELSNAPNRDLKTLNRMAERSYCLSVLTSICCRAGVAIPNHATIIQALSNVDKTF